MFFKFVLLSLLAFNYCFSVNSTTNELEDIWQQLKNNFSKVYESETEEKFRSNIFPNNLRKIKRHILEASPGLKSYTLKGNKFSNLSTHEINLTYNGYKPRTNYHSFVREFVRNESLVLPESLDWRKKGYVTPVKAQGKCKSSWAFSAIGALEGQQFRKTKKLVSLSVQQLIDCMYAHGCRKGNVKDAFDYIKFKKGIDTEDSYPYKDQENLCDYNPKNVGATVTGYVTIKSGDEDALKEAVATIGPVSAFVDGTQDPFLGYRNGVYFNPFCSNNLKQGVLVVGYGTTDDGKDYWIVKNSWGTDWGDSGYILMARNMENNCGIATDASYPLV